MYTAAVGPPPVTAPVLEAIAPAGRPLDSGRSCGSCASWQAAVCGTAVYVALKSTARRSARRAIPTEYYGLLGLPLFTSDPKEIKAAHRRMVKMVHPDVLGGDSAELQSIVTEAYRVLSKDEKREAYNEKLRAAKPSLAKSKWSEDTPQFAMGVFVDETKCESCQRCIGIASSTFAVHESPVRAGKAFVSLQYGDDRYIVREAVKECPTDAIRYVSREDVPKLEYAMTQVATLLHRARPWEKETLPGPFEVYQELMLDELIGMDMEKARASEKDPMLEAKVAEELSEKANNILEAASRLDEEVREKIWPAAFGSEAAQATQALDEQKVGKRSERMVEQGDARGVQRAEMKATLFYVLDEDGDGFLYDKELRSFADSFGFDGSEFEWAEYQNLCTEYRCSPSQGLDMTSFARLLDDADGCPLSDEELAALLRDSNQLPRAGS
eukprot:s217_g25.t1